MAILYASISNTLEDKSAISFLVSMLQHSMADGSGKKMVVVVA
jgi:hypothetical protein